MVLAIIPNTQKALANKFTPIIILAIIMIIFVILQSGQLQTQYQTQYDENFIKPKLDQCEITELTKFRAPVKLFLLCISDQLFDNPRTVEFILVVFMFPLVYGLTKEITKNRYAGLVSCAILVFDRIFSLQSFTIYGSSEWVFFFALTLYASYKIPYLTGVFFFLSITSKGLMLLFTPIILLWFTRMDAPVKSRTINVISISAVMVATFFVTFTTGEQLLQKIPLNMNPENAESALLNMLFVFRDDPNYLLLIFPASIIGLTFTIRNDKIAPILLVFIVLFYLSVLVLPLLSDYSMFDYRMIPMILLSSIGIGIFATNVISYDSTTNQFSVKKLQIFSMVIITLFITIIGVLILEENDLVYVSKIGLPVLVEEKWRFDPTRDDVFMQKITNNCNAVIKYEAKIATFKGLVGCNPSASDVEIKETEDAIKTIMKQLQNQLGN